MKDILKFLGKGGVLALAVIGTMNMYSFVSAQTNTEELSFGVQIEKLANSIQAFADALSPSRIKESNPYEDSFSTETYGKSSNDYEYFNPRCLDNPETWQSSYTKKDNISWDISKFPYNRTNSYVYENFLDINGDGLVDFVQSYLGINTKAYISSNESWNGKNIIYNPERSCILLNNGNGWDVVYKCIITTELTENGKKRPVYYGDCASL